MAKRMTRYDANLPRNLTYRKRRKSFYWRNPLTGEEFNLGAIARRDAISQAIEANCFIEKNYSPTSLLERLQEKKESTLSEWLDRYIVIIKRRKLAENTYKIRTGQIATINQSLGSKTLKEIMTKDIASFLETYFQQGKLSMAGGFRSVLSDIFREAIVEGHIENNPVAPTRVPTSKVKRERLELEQYKTIRQAAEHQPAWFGLSMDLALVTGQRREDVTQMRFSHIVDGCLLVEQGKTGNKLALPMDLGLNAIGPTLGDVIEQCRIASKSDYLISAGIRKNSPDGIMNPDSLTKGFVKARAATGIIFDDNPPTFHEIRSLAGRLYEKERGKEFAQKLLGHKSAKMTDKYLDTRGKEYTYL
ncbi:tyrosine-type recombinase/integrase [Brenneria goodwinii]|uniref:tyrosine-type recombinase/integrase n=1 Tax=Brenneria goodwinii TaxID=1109412 RepID=UPI000EF22187|nr:tyrosine-type recombinase/integrase [Brenneria goodwinii]MCG8155164.1 tyrosine-type recombinase/integrase [Brenneria goodwinii]MCG8159408.1 tyrosine-type recombinase/integrase [Brenneria goodwinii]MCG8164423.1 tyrosine-type recombinase/integrase [Brenneria goodwinii]MCG8169011.1 tyrosine-type recombinase/integrase [Brenneria goodwinii]MCG8173267.1 tyrosine-type recombinase/integrase [Brenneria goodwinii]